jgi:hypothetical protein
MACFAWLDALNLLDVFNYYLILGFLVSTGVSLRKYWAMVGLMCGFPKRWPTGMQLAVGLSLWLTWAFALRTHA